ncbi:MAG: DnaJ domain-containing protein [Myxococcota bacterium]|nr:DnaJ domain-containing protein [Myxococcota bacterium]
MSELSPTELRDLTDLFALVQGKNHYEILGIAVDAGTDDVKNSYYELSRKYHPDRFYRREISGYRDLIEAVFTGINQSYEVLADDTTRRRYDLEQARADRERQQAVDEEPHRRSKRRSWREKMGAGPPKTSAEPSSTASESAHEQAERKESSTKSVRTSIREAAPPRRPPPVYRPSTEQPEPGDAATKKEEAVPAEKPEPSEKASPETPGASSTETDRDVERAARPTRPRPRPVPRRKGGLDRGSRNPEKARKHFEEGKREYDSGNFIKAASSLYLAMTFDGDNEEYKALNEEVQQKARNMRSLQFVNQAESAESFGSWREALEHYQKAVECEPNEGLAYFRLAQLLIHKVDDPRAAMTNLRRAVTYEPDNHKYRLALAELYVLVGMPRNAIREYQRVLEADPKNGAAKQGLRKARG